MNKHCAPLLLITLVSAALAGGVCIFLLVAEMRTPHPGTGEQQHPAALSPFGVAPAKPASP